MSESEFAPVRMDQLGTVVVDPVQWLWHGYLARGEVTLLTSLWKAGKTTLLTGFLYQQGEGEEFLGRATVPIQALVVSEEPQHLWLERSKTIPVGAHTQLLSRPFAARPTLADWERLIRYATRAREADELDLLVIDPLASFLPGGAENDASRLLEALGRLHEFTSIGGSVLLLHHPRKGTSEEFQAARGSGAMLGFVEVIAELHWYGTSSMAERRRKLLARSRHQATPEQLVYEWDPLTGEFTALADAAEQSFHESWPTVQQLLKSGGAMSRWELREAWPEDQATPGTTTLHRWLTRAVAEKLARREGRGDKYSPYRYRLSTEYDRVMDSLEAGVPFVPGLE